MIILLSLLITAAVSILFGTAAYMFGISFWGATLIAFPAQIIIGYLYLSTMLARMQVRYIRAEADALAELAKQAANISCAYCRKVSIIPLRLDMENEMKCPTCEKISSIYISIESVQKTTPINVQKHVTLEKQVVDRLAQEAIVTNK